MTTVGDLVNQVRVMVGGGLPDQMSLLDADYVAGSGQIVVRYPAKNIQPGATIEAGITTFYVWGVSTDFKTFQVQAGIDGSPDLNMATNTIVRFRTAVSTWSIFNEWNRQTVALGSPYNGLYSFGTFGGDPDYISGVYLLPTTGSWATHTPLRLLRCRYRPFGVDYWVTHDHATWIPDEGMVRVSGPQPPCDTIQFVFAFGFDKAASLTTDPLTLGLTANTMDIPGLGVAAVMHRSLEGRRVQVTKAGDSRRAEEVQAGANIGVSRDWNLMRQQRINEELTRLYALYPARSPISGVGG